MFWEQEEDISIPLNPNYLDAFHSIEADSNNELTVVEADGGLVGMLQLTIHSIFNTHRFMAMFN